MQKDKRILSDLIIYMKYAKYLPKEKRRESWEEIVNRNLNMHIKKFPQLESDLRHVYTNYVLPKKVLPSMRSLQFGGLPIEINNSRLFNCAYLPIDDYRAFSETMFLLLSGCGVGYSVQKHHVEKLPEIKLPVKEKRYLIGDSIIGWSDAIKMLMTSYFTGGPKPLFDFRDIREKGAILVTAGGKAPGPEPLKRCLFEIEQILNRYSNGDKLSTIDCHSIQCHIADSVLSGGIRRSAMIAGFTMDDEDMLSCKSGNWWELNPHFARANNSAIIVNSRIKKGEFDNLWVKIENSGSGEPGLYFTNDCEYFTNPCVETSLRPFSFCNLVEINAEGIDSQLEFNNRSRAAAFINTIQASYTDFVYLRSIWKKTTEKDALIGCGITGIGSGTLDLLDKKEASDIVVEENKRTAKLVGINQAARCGVIKPAGTSSIVLGTSSGIHAYHNNFYIRRVRINKNEALYTYLSIYHSNLLEDDLFNPTQTAIISVPQKAPTTCHIRTESAIDLLERTKTYNLDWVRNSHNSGPNFHNVSATISIKDEEWKEVGEWMWNNRDSYHGLSVLPYSGHTYKQAPFEDCTEEEYNKLFETLTDLDLSKIVEFEDLTDLNDQQACSGSSCDVK
jgi:ribonucleoside-triphosphate reductase